MPWYGTKLEKTILVVAIVQSLLISIALLWTSSECTTTGIFPFVEENLQSTLPPIYNDSPLVSPQDPEIMVEELFTLSSSDDIHIRTCFYEYLQINCLVDIRKALLSSKTIIICPDNTPGEVITLFTNTWRGEKSPNLTNDFVKVICPCKDTYCSNYKEEIESNTFSLTQTTDTKRWEGPLLSNKPPSSFTYNICSVSAVLQGKPPAMDIWIKHHWESGVEHMFMYASEFHIPSKVYSTLKEQSYIEEIFWLAHYGLHQSSDMGQNLAYLDAVLRFRGICEWTLFLDIEDYFWLPEHGHDITYFVENELESNRETQTFFLPWQETYPKPCSTEISFITNNFVCSRVKEDQRNHLPMRFLTKTDLLIDFGFQDYSSMAHEAKIASSFGFQFLSNFTIHVEHINGPQNN